ncbi:MAG: hypothetical protein ACRDL7_13360, partial [Gaiellaceae bacterium]
PCPAAARLTCHASSRWLVQWNRSSAAVSEQPTSCCSARAGERSNAQCSAGTQQQVPSPTPW